MNSAAGASLNCMRISAFLSFSALPALNMNGTPAQRAIGIGQGKFTDQSSEEFVSIVRNTYEYAQNSE